MYTATYVNLEKNEMSFSVHRQQKNQHWHLKSHNKFKKKYKVKFDLLSDEKKEAIKAFKVWGKKKFMGKEFMGLIRSTFVIKNNKIIKEWRSVKVKDHAQEVLDFIKKY